MAEQVYEETDVCTIKWDGDIGAVVNTWHDYAAGDEYRRVFDRSLEVMEERNAGKVLADCRDLGPVKEEDQQWMERDWSPRADAAGLEYCAIIYPESAIAKMSVEKMAEGSEEAPVDLRVTDDLREARDWLSEQ